MTQKLIRVFLLVTIGILLLLGGCGKKEEAHKQIKLRLAFYGDIRNKPFGETLIKAFQEKYPSVRVEPIFIVREYSQKLLTMIAGGNAPDIMILPLPSW